MSNQHQLRASVLASYGATALEIEELLAYNQNIFDRSFSTLPTKFPLPPEPHVAAWEEYATLAQEIGVFQALSSKLVQLQFPILEGISQTQVYRFATRKGVSADDMVEATGLILQQPEQLQLILHQSFVGVIPVLLASNREDFVSLVQALTMRNEPKPVPDSMGAYMVTGFNNWDRVRQYRQQWSAKNFGNCSESSWLEEFGRLILQKHLYQDRLIILSDGFYSNVSASDIGLSEVEWRRISLTIRLEHECTHYFTQRLFGSMRNNLLDELIADYRGIVAAIGHYRADWFLRFLGLESFPDYREGGRLQNYRGQPPLSENAFKILQALVKSAAENLERFDAQYGQELRTLNSQPIMLIALTYLTLEELACSEAHSYIQKILDQLRTSLKEAEEHLKSKP
ncbi:hypothetical protein H6G97_29470 [Nostoc flagelliforme FACHB-838]|uniref:Uncharacterized protein n=1 Tax=Nostoc flagelliforme FACHB-838 TaxID=2692904 RepID=A0ABR8DW53_9NOSO|nr:hypothetical protein [Nostoc flagelliforme]MBD2533468.1 hypothetical protein [Nostoc flagelliforme FACHB-838]